MNRSHHRVIFAALALAACTLLHAAEPLVTPHPVPWEFASDRYNVSVNGKPVTVFFAAMNVHFASFDFTGQADGSSWCGTFFSGGLANTIMHCPARLLSALCARLR